LPPALKQLQQLLTKGMQATASLWPPLQSAYKLVHQAVQILANQEQHTGTAVRERYLAFVRQMQDEIADVGVLATSDICSGNGPVLPDGESLHATTVLTSKKICGATRSISPPR
jgi:hypothetical protein